MKQIRKKEICTVLSKMKKEKAMNPDNITVQAWNCLVYLTVNLFIPLFNNLLEGKKIRRVEKENINIIFKIKLMSKIAVIIEL